MDANLAGGSSSVQNVDDPDEVFEMKDILKSQDEMMEQVAAVLGAGDDFNCTYAEGYVKRQALYACLTCIPEAKTDHNKSAGVCLACSYHCHDGHNLVELYTKRNFRCDCGNKKFDNFTCNLNNDKEDFNTKNKYNQNFSGLYCVCAKPYPDPEDTIEDEMTQCIACEDWYHSRHLSVMVPPNYDEMICVNCVEQHDFLLYYDGLALTNVVNESCTNVVVEVVDNPNAEEAGAEVTKAEECDTTEKDSKPNGSANPTTVNGNGVSSTETNSECTKPKIKSTNISTKFMEDINWRTKLCKCSDCMALYEKEDVAYLLDVQDTVHAYEDKGKAKLKELNEKNIETEKKYLNSLDRVPLMEALAGYNEFKEQLSDYLKKFAENKKVIRVEDVQEFFTQLKARKRQKTEMPYYCR